MFSGITFSVKVEWMIEIQAVGALIFLIRAEKMVNMSVNMMRGALVPSTTCTPGRIGPDSVNVSNYKHKSHYAHTFYSIMGETLTATVTANICQDGISIGMDSRLGVPAKFLNIY